MTSPLKHTIQRKHFSREKQNNTNQWIHPQAAPAKDVAVPDEGMVEYSRWG